MQRAKDGKDGVLPIALGGIPTVGKVMYAPHQLRFRITIGGFQFCFASTGYRIPTPANHLPLVLLLVLMLLMLLLL